MPFTHPPHVLAVLPALNPSAMMDVVKPLLELEKRGFLSLRVTLEPYLRPDDWQDVALLVLCRNLEPRGRAILDQAQALRIPYIYDLDDDLLNVPPDSDPQGYYSHPPRRLTLQAYLRGASLVRVYSAPLVERIAAFTSRVEQVLPPLDWPLVQNYLPAQRSAPLKIVYATSRAGDGLYRIFEPALLNLLPRYAGQVQLVLWGCRPASFEGLPGVSFLPFDDDYERFLRRFAGMGFDIGLAPLPDDAFHRAKTDNKFREYGACGMAGIYSDVSVYQAVVQPGVSGCLAQSTPQAWETALESLLRDPQACRRMGQAAQDSVRRRYDPEQFIQVWRRQIEDVLAGKYALPFATGVDTLPLSFDPAAPAGSLERGLAWLAGGSLPNRLRMARLHLRNLQRLQRINQEKRL